MEKEIPKIAFKDDHSLHIEVLTFAELSDKLSKSHSHNPYAFHKIEFFLILIVTKHSYTHFVDFNSHVLPTGTALFVAKNQVHHFNKGLANYIQ